MERQLVDDLKPDPHRGLRVDNSDHHLVTDRLHLLGVVVGEDPPHARDEVGGDPVRR